MKHSKVHALLVRAFLPTSEDPMAVFLDAIIDINCLSVVRITSRNFQVVRSHPTNTDRVPKACAK